ncbi:MAG: hypothetical protein VB104_12450 [Candidatus Limiplasma sp.]|nr:hypothetical protein [Candidatus Limiplasma sp.]
MRKPILFISGVVSVGLSLVAYTILLYNTQVNMVTAILKQTPYAPDFWHHVHMPLFALVSVYLMLGLWACVYGIRGFHAQKKNCEKISEPK